MDKISPVINIEVKTAHTVIMTRLYLSVDLNSSPNLATN